jgi:hypothetical protein
VKFVAATELPDLREPTVDLVFPEPRVLPVLRALMASQALMELPVNAARPERRVPKARLVLRGLKALKVDRQTGNVLAQESTLRRNLKSLQWKAFKRKEEKTDETEHDGSDQRQPS